MSTPNWAPRVPPCESCGGQQVGNLGLVSQYHVGLHPNAKALAFQPMSRVNATVCLNCGRSTFYAADLDKLRAEVQQHPERFIW